MADVAFHFNVPERYLYACRWVRKAVREANKVIVLGESDSLTRFDQLLWTFDPMSFIPHIRVLALEEMDDEALLLNPVILLEQLPTQQPAALASARILNFSPAVAEPVLQYGQITEIVSSESDDRLQARTRWQAYKNAGCTLIQHNYQS